MLDPMTVAKWLLVGPMGASAFALASVSTKLILAALFGRIRSTEQDMAGVVVFGAVFALTVSLYLQMDHQP